jgi:hypothetical protein
MQRLSTNSRATISSTAIFLSQQVRQYRSSPLGSDTSFAPHNAHLDSSAVFRGMTGHSSLNWRSEARAPGAGRDWRRHGIAASLDPEPGSLV